MVLENTPDCFVDKPEIGDVGQAWRAEGTAGSQGGLESGLLQTAAT